MSDYIGNIAVPTIPVVGTFPITPEYPWGRANDLDIAIHQFGSGNAKMEQRFLIGSGARQFTVKRSWLSEVQRTSLRNFWESQYGPYGMFTYNLPSDGNTGISAVTCRFKDEPLSWQMVANWVSSVGVTLIEVPNTNPLYTATSVVERFPSNTLAAGLLSQTQVLVPLVVIQPLKNGYPTIYLSDRRCQLRPADYPTHGDQQYQARLLRWEGISQSIGNEADQATFVFGNADRVMRDLCNDVDLFRASLEFYLFHTDTQTLIKLWKGDVTNWALDSGPEFKITASDGLYELNLPYPTRKCSRTCWKPYNTLACPFSTEGALDLAHFSDADASTCDKGYDTPNGCLAHGMKHRYGGILALPQTVRVLDNSTGTWGFGRSPLTSTSIVNDSIYDQVVPEIYTDDDLPVQCKIASGRDESDFYEALGIVGEGPIGAYSFPALKDLNNDGVAEYVGPELDGQPYHGFPSSGLGLRWYLGNDPAGANEYFSLDQSGNQTGGDWRKVYYGSSTYLDNFAAGTAFIAIRRSDAKGLQLSKPSDHAMSIYVREGLGGWVWTAPGSRTYAAKITNPVWIAVNMLLRARGLRFGAAMTSSQLDYSEKLFDVNAAVASASICDQSVDALVYGTYRVWVEDSPGDPDAGTLPVGHWINQPVTTETQFRFRGTLKEEKPLRDWIQEVLMNCLGYYTFSFGKLKIGIRENASATEDFNEGNILFRSLQLSPKAPTFNHLTANFADSEFLYAGNSATVYDIEHAALIGAAAGPQFLKGNINLSGTFTKSQAARIISTRLREELGGVGETERRNARKLAFRTTVLALNVEPGTVSSMTHEDMPGSSGKFRVLSWKLNSDYSIDIQGETVTDSMYDLVSGPKPADVGTALTMSGNIKVWSVTEKDTTLEAINQVLTVYAVAGNVTITLPQESLSVGDKIAVVRGQGSNHDVVVQVYGGDSIDNGGSSVTSVTLTLENDYVVVEGE